MIQLRMTLALTLLLGGVCFAQARLTGSEVLVFGDVGKPGLFSVKGGETVAQLISGAGGLTSKSANVRIVQVGDKGAKVVYAAHISQDQSSNQLVRRDDILVVHSLDRLAGTSQRPPIISVLHDRWLPIFIDLDPTQEVRASDVMGDSEVNLAGRKFEIIRTNPKALPIPPNTDAVLMHGDLLLVGGKTSVRTSQVRTVSQEVAGGTPSLPSPGTLLVPTSDVPESSQQDDTEPVPVQANYGALTTTPPSGGQFDGSTAMQPMTPQGVTQPPMPADPGETVDPLSIDPFGPSTTANTGMAPPAGMQLMPGMVPPPQSNPANPGFAPGPQGNVNAYGVPMPNAQPAGTGYPQTAENPGTQDESSALPLPSELDSASVIDGDSNATMWYVAGLGAALLLVIGAWVYGSRAVAESPQIDKARYKRPVSPRHSDKIKHPPVSAGTPRTSATSQQPVAAKPEKPKIKPIAPAATPAAAPVAVEQPVQVPQQMVAPQQPMPVAYQAPLPAPPQPQPVAPVTQQTAQAFNSLPTPASQPAPAVATRPVQPAPRAPEPIPVPDTSTTRVLDALISNSIPITEKPVQLPVHLEFYGDSNGPKNLRFDPPQNALRGHHMGVRAGAGQRQSSNAESSNYQ